MLPKMRSDYKDDVIRLWIEAQILERIAYMKGAVYAQFGDVCDTSFETWYTFTDRCALVDSYSTS